MSKQNETKDAAQPSQQRDWKGFIYTEGGVVLFFCVIISAWYWYSALFGDGYNTEGFLYRRFSFLKSIFGEHYLSILLSITTLVVALEVWRKGSK